MSSHKRVFERLRHTPEVIILGIACLSPWAIGAMDAWVQLILDGGLVLLTILGFLTVDRSDWARRLFCVPSLALAALALLALVQAVPLPTVVLKAISPSTYAWRAGLAPDVPRRVQGDSRPPVPPPASTLSHDPDASLRTAAQLLAAWLLFQGVLGSGRGVGPLRRFGLATVVNAALLTVFAIAQALTWNGKIYGIRPTMVGDRWLTGGPFVLHNHLAAYLNVGFGLAVGFLLATLQGSSRAPGRREPRSGGKGTSLWAGYAAGLIFAGILASHSRSAFLAMVGSTAVTIFVLRPRSIRLGAGLGVMLVVTALFLIVMGSTSPFQRLATIADSSQESIIGRFQVWGVALRAWRAFPLWGTGLGSFPAATGSFYRLHWGDVEEASRQARIGLTLHPDHPGIRRALQSALDAYARGAPATASQK